MEVPGVSAVPGDAAEARGEHAGLDWAEDGGGLRSPMALLFASSPAR